MCVCDIQNVSVAMMVPSPGATSVMVSAVNVCVRLMSMDCRATDA
jgi:hypothetical protein